MFKEKEEKPIGHSICFSRFLATRDWLQPRLAHESKRQKAVGRARRKTQNWSSDSRQIRERKSREPTNNGVFTPFVTWLNVARNSSLATINLSRSVQIEASFSGNEHSPTKDVYFIWLWSKVSSTSWLLLLMLIIADARISSPHERWEEEGKGEGVQHCITH